MKYTYLSNRTDCRPLHYICVAAGLLMICWSGPTAFAVAPLQFDLKILSDDLDDSQIPIIDGDNVIWIGQLGSDRQVYDYNVSTGARGILPTIDPLPDSPASDGRHVVWESGGRINLHDLSTGSTTPISTVSYNGHQKVSDNHVIWLEGRAQDSLTRLMDYNIATQVTLQLIGYDGVINDLQIKGNDIVWDQRTSSSSTSAEIFHYSLLTGVTTRLTTNAVPDLYPKLSDGNVVWQTFDTEPSAEIFRRDLFNGITERVTNNSIADRTPEISGANVVWQQSGSVNNVFYRNLATGVTTPLTHATTYPESYGVPKVSGSNVMFFGDVGPSALDREVYYYDLANNSTTRVTTNNFFEQYGDISGRNIIFLRDRSLQTNKWDVVLATPVPEPTSAVWILPAIFFAKRRTRRASCVLGVSL